MTCPEADRQCPEPARCVTACVSRMEKLGRGPALALETLAVELAKNHTPQALAACAIDHIASSASCESMALHYLQRAEKAEAEAASYKQRCEDMQHRISVLIRECESADAAKQEIENIGQLTGCGHTEGLSNCVRQRIEQSDLVVEQLRTDIVKERDALREALEACSVFTTPLERLKNWNEYKQHASELRIAALAKGTQ